MDTLWGSYAIYKELIIPNDRHNEVIPMDLDKLPKANRKEKASVVALMWILGQE